MNRHICGFLSTIYYFDITAKVQFDNFQAEHNRSRDIKYKSWTTHKRERRLHMVNIRNYGTSENRDEFLKFFSIDQFKKLSDEERAKHEYLACQQCARLPALAAKYKLKNCNLKFVVEPETPTNSIRVAQESTPDASTADPEPVPRKKRKAQHKDDVLKSVLREHCKEERDAQRELQKWDDFFALNSGSVSMKQYEHLRRRKYQDTARPRRLRKHVGNLDNYKYDRALLLLKVADYDPWSNINHQGLSREINLVNKVGVWPRNGGQVVKAILEDLGYDIRVIPKYRVAWKNHINHQLNICVPTSPAELQQMKKESIESGQINIGEPIVPIDYEVVKVNPDGNLETKTYTVSGRKFDLLSIRKDHLQRMSNYGILRKTDTDKLDDQEISELLDKHGEVVMDDAHYNREQAEKFTRTRNMVVWHDHSDILGKSHYLFMVWFLYDKMVFLTDNEYNAKIKSGKRVSVQSVVEKPYICILARSGATVKDQLMYVPTRLEDLREMDEAIELDGAQYFDELRFFSGDSPARNLGSGQQGPSGHWPCMCGRRADTFGTKTHFNADGVFTDLSERTALLNKSKTWEDAFTQGDLAPFDQITKKDDIIRELEARGIEVDDFDTLQDVKDKFTYHMKGMRRPPALLCTDEECQLDSYECLMLEPLHDIKNVVNRIFEELCHIIPNEEAEFRKDVAATIAGIKGDKSDMSGSQSREGLIKLTNFMSSKCSEIGTKIYTMLLSLVELQKLAYSMEEHRSQRSILRGYCQAFRFGLSYTDLFSDNPNVKKPRSVFGMSFHSLTCHLPDMLRIVNGGSIVAEQAERHFNKLRNLALRTTNRQADKVISDALFRIQVQRTNNEDYVSLAFEVQQASICSTLDKSAISQASSSLFLGCNTIFKHSTLAGAQRASLQFLKNIADYLEHGQGVWYDVHDDGIEFLDGIEELDARVQGPKLKSFRSTGLKDTKRISQRAWIDCLQRPSELGIPLIKKLAENNLKQKASKDKSEPRRTLASALEQVRCENEIMEQETMEDLPELTGLDDHVEDEAPNTEYLEEDSESTSFVKSVPLISLGPEGLPSEEYMQPRVTVDGPEKENCSSTCDATTTRKEKRKNLTTEELVRSLWVCDKKTLKAFYKARRDQPAKPNPLQKIKLRDAAKKLIQPLLELLGGLKEKEQEATMESYKQTHHLELEQNSYSAQIKAVQKLLSECQYLTRRK